MNDITWTGEHAAEWAKHYGGQVTGAGTTTGYNQQDETARLRRTIELLHEYGEAKLGDDWWPSNSGDLLGDEGRELESLLASIPNPAYLRAVAERTDGPEEQLRERMTAWGRALDTGDVSGLNDILPPDEEPSA